MKERPILMSALMVVATLRPVEPKGQTRRVTGLDAINENSDDWVFICYCPPDRCDRTLAKFWNKSTLRYVIVACPYGVTGRNLWVREGWRVGKPHNDRKPADILPTCAPGKGVTVLYEAGGAKSVCLTPRDEPIYPDDEPMPTWAGKKRPSIHMPRAFSRIDLRITEIRVERLHDISEADCMAEGLLSWESPVQDQVAGSIGGIMATETRYGFEYPAEPEGGFSSAKYAYQSLWEHINGPGSWDANPWLWVISFERVTP